MDIQEIKQIVDPAIETIFEQLKENNIQVKKTILKKIISEAIDYNIDGSKSKSSEVSIMFSGRGRAWAKVTDDKSLYNDIICFLKHFDSKETSDLVDLFEQAGFIWMRFSGASSNHVSFNLRHKGSKLENSIVYNVSYDVLDNIENLEGVPHKLGLESGDFSSSTVSRKNIVEGDHKQINSNIISLEDLI